MTFEQAEKLLAERGLVFARWVNADGDPSGWVVMDARRTHGTGRTWQEAFANATGLAPL